VAPNYPNDKPLVQTLAHPKLAVELVFVSHELEGDRHRSGRLYSLLLRNQRVVLGKWQFTRSRLMRKRCLAIGHVTLEKQYNLAYGLREEGFSIGSLSNLEQRALLAIYITRRIESPIVRNHFFHALNAAHGEFVRYTPIDVAAKKEDGRGLITMHRYKY
jgi:hypothetical protein